MEINSIPAFFQMKPNKPPEPMPPPGGNIENRQPPPEPTGPFGTQQNQDSSVQSALNCVSENPKKLVDIYA